MKQNFLSSSLCSTSNSVHKSKEQKSEEVLDRVRFVVLMFITSYYDAVARKCDKQKNGFKFYYVTNPLTFLGLRFLGLYK